MNPFPSNPLNPSSGVRIVYENEDTQVLINSFDEVRIRTKPRIRKFWKKHEAQTTTMSSETTKEVIKVLLRELQ
jgi:hypothetical protein